MYGLSEQVDVKDILTKIEDELWYIGKMIGESGCATLKRNIPSWDGTDCQLKGIEKVQNWINKNSSERINLEKEHEDVWIERQENATTKKNIVEMEERKNPRKRLLTEFRGILGEGFGKQPMSEEKHIWAIEYTRAISKRLDKQQLAEGSNGIRGKKDSKMETKNDTSTANEISSSQSEICSSLKTAKSSSDINSILCGLEEVSAPSRTSSSHPPLYFPSDTDIRQLSSSECESTNSVTAESETKCSNVSEKPRTSVMSFPGTMKYSKHIVENWVADNDARFMAKEADLVHLDCLSIVSAGGGWFMERPFLDVGVWESTTEKPCIANAENGVDNTKNNKVEGPTTRGGRTSTFRPLGQHHVTNHVYDRRPTTPSHSLSSTPQVNSQKDKKEKRGIRKLLEKIFPCLKNKDAKYSYLSPPRTPTSEAGRRLEEKERTDRTKLNNENYLSIIALPATPRSYYSHTKSILRNNSRGPQSNLNTMTSSLHSSLDSSRESLVNVGSILNRPRSTSPLKHHNAYDAIIDVEIQLEQLSEQRQFAAPSKTVSTSCIP